MAGTLAGQVAVVTGGSRGIGRACVLALAAEGADVVINYVSSEDAAASCKAAAEALGVRAIAVRADVGHSDQAAGLIDAALAAFGRIDILVNNAGISGGQRLQYTTDEEWESTVRTNLSSAFYCTRAVIPAMRERGYGRIVNIASMAGQSTNWIGLGPYGATKAGMIALTQSAARELGRYGIAVNAICPGYVKTDMTWEMTDEQWQDVYATIPVGRIGTAEEIALSVVFLCGPGGAFYTGSQLSPNGGMHM